MLKKDLFFCGMSLVWGLLKNLKGPLKKKAFNFVKARVTGFNEGFLFISLPDISDLVGRPFLQPIREPLVLFLNLVGYSAVGNFAGNFPVTLVFQ